MKDKLLHFLGELFAKSIWITIGLIVLSASIIISPLALLAYIYDKIYHNRHI